jgi:glucose-1-phosphate cytidylyltransferase
MKCVILAGGLGTRISEESQVRPKPMIEIGGKPILWHIMKAYSHFGIHDFIICLGYKGYVIKEYFSNYFLHTSDVTFDLTANRMDIHQNNSEPWKITLIDTGEASMTGGRLARIQPYVQEEEAFCFTYGDGVSDINIHDLIAFHRQQNTIATVTGVRPPGRFGALLSHNGKVTDFVEKPQGDGQWINGGFFVLSPRIFEFLSGDATIFEKEPLSNLAAASQLSVYEHHGFWQAMDTLRDKNHLEELWAAQHAPWKVW